ncbi:unnamed protein product, partial [Aphanomyces euteiches]
PNEQDERDGQGVHRVLLRDEVRQRHQVHFDCLCGHHPLPHLDRTCLALHQPSEEI